MEDSPSVDGFVFSVEAPPIYQRLIDRIENVVLAPLSWLNLPGGDAPASPGRSQYRVIVTNPRGNHRTLRLIDNREAALRKRDELVARAKGIGIVPWSREVPIPEQFFE